MYNQPQIHSQLSQTGTELPPGLSHAPLGNFNERKNRGRQQTITDPAAQALTLLDIQSDDQLAQALTVSCNIRPATPQVPGSPQESIVPSVVLRVTWGTDGGFSSAEVDATQGRCFSVHASSLRVVAAAEDPAPIVPVEVGLSVGYGETITHPRRTIRSGLAPDAVALQRLPPFAHTLFLERSGNFPTHTLRAEFLDAGGTSIAGHESANPITLQVPRGAAQLRITDTQSAAVTVSAVYDLAF